MNRRFAREIILKILFEVELSNNFHEEVLAEYLKKYKPDKNTTAFISEIVRGTISNMDKIDELIQKHIIDWKLNRLANVDKTILRFAIYEILYMPDIPYSVTINEAIEITKKFGTEESAKFVNGVLGQIVKNMSKDGKT